VRAPAKAYALEPIYDSLVDEQGDVPAQTRQAAEQVLKDLRGAMNENAALPQDQ
jgi:hypothetical protein